MAKRFRYTTALKSETQGGAAAVVMAIISAALFVVGILCSYIFNGNGGAYLGVIGLIAMLLSCCGFFFGLNSFSEKDKSHRYSTAGAMANGIISVVWLALFLLGV